MPKNRKSDEVIKAILVDSTNSLHAEDVEVIPHGEVIDRNHKDIPIESIIEYASKGLTLGDIARLCNCSKQNIQQRLKAVAFDKTDLENFKNHRKDVFAFIQSRLLNSIDDETIKEMNPYQRVISVGVLYDKERLERGQATEIIDSFAITASLEELQKREEELLKKIEIKLINNDKSDLKSNGNQTNSEEIKRHEKR